MRDNHFGRSMGERLMSLARVARGAIVGGIKGAAVAAAVEAAPRLGKILMVLLVIVLTLPMVIFTAIPNLFFGYGSLRDPWILQMTEKALAVGDAYLSLDILEDTKIDAIVTTLMDYYETAGTIIDKVNIFHSFQEEDLLWMIAINSVSHQQDLATMDLADIQNLSISRLTYTPTLEVLETAGGVFQNILTVRFDPYDPEAVMEELDFDEEERTWAAALFETLKESDALAWYESQFGPFEPDYDGDGSYTGGLEHGGSYGTTIDVSGFVDSSTKNNLDLAAYAIQAWENNWGYVWGTFGQVLTPSLFQYKLEQYPDGVGGYADFIRDNWVGGRTTDCVGLIKGYGWLDPAAGTIQYGTNGMPDYGADQMYRSAQQYGTDYGSMSTMPDVVGLALWKPGHIGVYIGNGYAVEAMGTTYGVVKTQVDGRGWSGWCKIPFINYLEVE